MEGGGIRTAQLGGRAEGKIEKLWHCPPTAPGHKLLSAHRFPRSAKQCCCGVDSVGPAKSLGIERFPAAPIFRLLCQAHVRAFLAWTSLDYGERRRLRALARPDPVRRQRQAGAQVSASGSGSRQPGARGRCDRVRPQWLHRQPNRPGRWGWAMGRLRPMACVRHLRSGGTRLV